LAARKGVYRSDEGGDTWLMCNVHYPERFKINFGNSRVMRIAFHPTNPSIIYAVAEIENAVSFAQSSNDGVGSPAQGLALPNQVSTFTWTSLGQSSRVAWEEAGREACHYLDFFESNIFQTTVEYQVSHPDCIAAHCEFA
jgi:hypothetical protein